MKALDLLLAAAILIAILDAASGESDATAEILRTNQLALAKIAKK